MKTSRKEKQDETMTTNAPAESVKPKRTSTRKKAVEKPKPKNGVFKIALTAVYNNAEMDADQIADGVFEAMTSVGKGLSLLHVDSVRRAAKPDDEIRKILVEVAAQRQEAMSKVTTRKGDPFVVIENKTDNK